MKLAGYILRFIIRFVVLYAAITAIMSFAHMPSIVIASGQLVYVMGFLLHAVIKWRDIFGYNIVPEIGDRFYSRFYNNYGTITKVEGDDDWWFVLDGATDHIKGTQDADRVKWIKKDI